MKCYQHDKSDYIASECLQKKAKIKMLEEADDISFNRDNKFNLNILNLKNK